MHFELESANINKVAVKGKEKYFIDTNVWFWFVGGGVNGQSGKAYQILDYPKFIERILDAGARMYHSSLTLAELAHIIEREEYKKQALQ